MVDSFNKTVSEAVDDFAANGYTGAERLAYWQDRIRRAAEESLLSQEKMTEALRRALGTVYARMVERGGVLKFHSGVQRFGIDRVRPELRAVLSRRVAASADLIKNNREEAIAKTMRRFAGWATSVPPGGVSKPGRRTEKAAVGKALRSLPFEERRVLIDQGHKLTAAVSRTVAEGGGAIAGVWNSHWRQPGYDYRPDHKERDGGVYLIRGSWAHERGLVRAGEAGYYDQVTAVAEEPFCRCFMTWLYALRALPDDMLTAKGKAALAEARAAIEAL